MIGNQSARWTLRNGFLPLLLLGVAVGCGGSTEEGDGGGAGSGGTGATGGSGGTAGTAGEAGTGGSAGTGGTGGTGGAAGTSGTGGTAGTGGTETGGTGGTGPGGQSGDCTPGSPTEVCPPDGSTCTEIVPGGFRVCAKIPDEATECLAQGFDECCNSSECSEGACYQNNVMPNFGCGGAQPMDMNVCATDACDSDADCMQGVGQMICAPRGVGGSPIRHCMVAACRTDVDCTAEPGGICAPVQNPCCSSWEGLYCVYPSNGCRTQADCQNGDNCIVDYAKGEGVCTSDPVACPA